MCLARDGAPGPIAFGNGVDAAESVDISCGCAICRNNNAGGTQAGVAGDSPVDSIDWGSQVASNNVTVYFAPVGETYDGVTSELARAAEAPLLPSGEPFTEA